MAYGADDTCGAEPYRTLAPVGTFVGLLLWLAPLTVLAMISPVVFVNASTVAANRGPRYRWRFIAGNAAVLVALGALAMGLLGAAVEEAALRQLSSRWVEGVLGLLLGLLSATLLRSLLADRDSPRAEAADDEGRIGTPSGAGRPATVLATGDPAALTGDTAPLPTVASLPRSMGGWGALGMITNLTTVSLYVAMAQRIGVTVLPWAVRIGVLAVVTALVLVPAWMPMLLASVLPGRVTVGPGVVRRISSWARGIACLASGIGAVYLVGQAVLG